MKSFKTRDFQAALTAVFDCSCYPAEHYDGVYGSGLVSGCEDLLYFSDEVEAVVEYEKLPIPESVRQFTNNERKMIDSYLKNCDIKVLEDAKVFYANIVGTGEKALFVALPDYEERMRTVEKAVRIAEKEPFVYASFLEKVNSGREIYDNAEEIIESYFKGQLKKKNGQKKKTIKEQTFEEEAKQSLQNDEFDLEYADFLKKKKQYEADRNQGKITLHKKKIEQSILSKIISHVYSMTS